MSSPDADLPVIEFLAPMPGFPDHRRFVLLRLESGVVYALLDVHEPDRLLVLLVVTTGETSEDATANLLAPIVIDQTTRRAVQAVLVGSGLPVSAKLLGSAIARARGGGA